MQNSWRPSASIETLHKRAAMIQSIRQFFYRRNILEVETPHLSRHTITDPYIETMHTAHSYASGDSMTLYLQSSPEYSMKRLLAAGSQDIFQIAKAFRNDEVGSHHNPEFTMLEWYRINYTMQDLVNEVKALLIEILALDSIEQATYNELFTEYCRFCPSTVSTKELIEYCHAANLQDYLKSFIGGVKSSTKGEDELLKDSLLQVLFHIKIEKKIGRKVPMVVTHFPASQASLAKIDSDTQTAKRFEVYYKNIELANGFEELQDHEIQEQRFNKDNQKRTSLGLQQKPLDLQFLQALKHGLPFCSGVALGVDRLLMLALNKKHIEDVLSFSFHNC